MDSILGNIFSTKKKKKKDSKGSFGGLGSGSKAYEESAAALEENEKKDKQLASADE